MSSMEFKPVVVKMEHPGHQGRGAIVCHSMGELNLALGQIFMGQFGPWDLVELEPFIEMSTESLTMKPKHEFMTKVKAIIRHVDEGELTHQDFWRMMGEAAEKYATAMALPDAG